MGGGEPKSAATEKSIEINRLVKISFFFITNSMLLEAFSAHPGFTQVKGGPDWFFVDVDLILKTAIVNLGDN